MSRQSALSNQNQGSWSENVPLWALSLTSGNAIEGKITEGRSRFCGGPRTDSALGVSAEMPQIWPIKPNPTFFPSVCILNMPNAKLS